MSTHAFIGTLDPTTDTFRARYVHSDGYPTWLGYALTHLVSRHARDLARLVTVLTEDHHSWSSIDPRTTADMPNHLGDRGTVVAGVGLAYSEHEPDEWITGTLNTPSRDAAFWSGAWGYLFDSTDPATARLHLIAVTDRFQVIGHVAVAQLHHLDWAQLQTAIENDQPPPAPMRAGAAHTTSRGSTMRISGPADLVVALPVLLGFHPVESLVLICTGRRERQRIGLTVRADLPALAHAGAFAEQVAAHLRRDNEADTAALVIVAAADTTGPAHARSAQTSPPHATLAAAITAGLAAHGIEVHTCVWAPAVAAGAPWRCYRDCRCSGILDDPAGSLFTAEMIARGKPVYTDRSELIRLVAATPAASRRTPWATPTGTELLSSPTEAATGANGDVAGIELHERARAAASVGRLELDEHQLRALAAALGRPRVRDTVLVAALSGRAVSTAADTSATHTGATDASATDIEDTGDGDATDIGPGYETLWAALARELPDPDAADPAALLAAAALARGDGAMANIALDRAEAACPDHRLTGLLRHVAALGLPPEQVRSALLGRSGEGR